MIGWIQFNCNFFENIFKNTNFIIHAKEARFQASLMQNRDCPSEEKGKSPFCIPCPLSLPYGLLNTQPDPLHTADLRLLPWRVSQKQNTYSGKKLFLKRGLSPFREVFLSLLSSGRSAPGCGRRRWQFGSPRPLERWSSLLWPHKGLQFLFQKAQAG